MLKRILVGLNGSEYSRAATELALRWAKRHQAAIEGLGIVDVPHLTAPDFVPLGAGTYKVQRDVALVTAADEQMAELLADFEARCSTAGVSCRTNKLAGDPEKLLVREAQRADLLMVGRKTVPHELGVPASLVLSEVLRHATRPVLCVPATPNDAGGVLVAYDGSAQAAKSLQVFEAIGLANDRDIHILTVSSNPADRTAGQRAAEYLQIHGHQVQVHFESSPTAPHRIILAEAKRLDAGLIVMGCYGQSPFKEMFFGSVTAAVLRGTPLPLFLYH
jgi:nucleotide-binding universal stress UspA family protein